MAQNWKVYVELICFWNSDHEGDVLLLSEHDTVL